MPNKTSGKKTTASKGTRKTTTKTCCACELPKPLKKFYRSYNPLHADGYLPMCKDCLKNSCYDEDIDDVDVEKLKKILRQIDRPYIEKYFNAAVNQYEKLYGGKVVPKGNKKEIIGYYFKNIQTLTQIRTLNWEQGLVYNNNAETKNDDHITTEVSNDDKIVYQVFEDDDDFQVTNDIVALFGGGYTKKEYKSMVDKFNFLKQNYPSTTNLHIEALVDYVRKKVKEETAIANGNIKESKSWGDLAQKAAEKAKINPNQLSQKDLQGGLNSFSEIFQAVEQAVDIVPILPEFKYRPNDAPDFIIWCFVNYVRNLEGKPTCEYSDLYKFYDERKQEYINQYGDPYGIFKDDPTLNNRAKIEQFIQIPPEYEDEE